MDTILKGLKKATKNENAFTGEDTSNPYAVEEWIDTGCYALNAMLSDGDIFKGLPKGKRIVLAGPTSTAKSYFLMFIIKSFMENQDNPYVVIFESEGASITNMIKMFGIPKEKILILPVFTVESFRTQVTNLLESIKEKKKEDPSLNFLIALDSLGMLGTSKEYTDAVTGSDKTDMTRAKIIRSIFRLITLDLSLTQTTFIATNHVGANIGGYGPVAVQGGGAGIQYASDVTIMLSKAKEKDGTAHIGALITCRVDKSRYQPEGNVMKIALIFKKGIFKYSDLIEKGLEFDIIKKEGYSLVLPDGTKKRKKDMIKEANEHFSGENLQKLRDAIYYKYSFGDSENFEFEDINTEIDHLEEKPENED